MRTIVCFRSEAFETEREEEDFINPGNFGRDVAAWLREKLSINGSSPLGEIGQEDHGWYFGFLVEDQPHDLVIGYQHDLDRWICWVERRVGCLLSMLGQRRKGVRSKATRAVHRVLREHADIITAISWHTWDAFYRDPEDPGSSEPD